jgi:hypothetical protein
LTDELFVPLITLDVFNPREPEERGCRLYACGWHERAATRCTREETAAMTLIDWSDPEMMLGLLVEYVEDEATVESDRDRAAFLRHLARGLMDGAPESGQSASDIAKYLRCIRSDQPREFVADPVLVHLTACIEELDRIAATV